MFMFHGYIHLKSKISYWGESGMAVFDDGLDLSEN